MNVNQDYKDFTQYSIKSSEILANIFETINKFATCNNDNEKDQIYSELSENITNFELTLDNCSIDINEAVANSLIILSSIEFNKDIIENMMGEDILNFNEEKFSIFDTNTKDSNFLEYIQEYDTYKSEIPDYDLIN